MNERGPSHDLPDAEFDSVRRAYRAAAGRDEPPEAVDAAILAAARRSVNAGPRRAAQSWHARWTNQIAVAAVLVLTVSIGMMALNEPSTVISVPGETSLRAPAAPVMAEIREAPAAMGAAKDKATDTAKDATTRGAARPDATLKEAEPGNATASGMKAKIAVQPAPPKEDRFEESRDRKQGTPAQANAPAPFPVSQTPAAALSASAGAPAAIESPPAPRSVVQGSPAAPAAQDNAAPAPASAADMPAAPKPERARAQAAGALQSNNVLEKKTLQDVAPAFRETQNEPPAARAAARTAAPAAAADALEVQRQKSEVHTERDAEEANPEEWLKRIETLRKAGETAKAKDELGKFVKRYPLHPLPDVLKALR